MGMRTERLRQARSELGRAPVAQPRAENEKAADGRAAAVGQEEAHADDQTEIDTERLYRLLKGIARDVQTVATLAHVLLFIIGIAVVLWVIAFVMTLSARQ